MDSITMAKKFGKAGKHTYNFKRLEVIESHDHWQPEKTWHITTKNNSFICLFIIHWNFNWGKIVNMVTKSLCQYCEKGGTSWFEYQYLKS